VEYLSAENLPEATDEELVSVIHKQPQAFDILLNRYRTIVVRMANSCAENSVDAADYAQEGLLGLLAAANSYQQDFGEQQASFRTYAFRCIRNRIRNASRRESGYHRYFGASFDDPDDEFCELIPDDSDTPEQVFLHNERINELYATLKEVLSSQEWEVLSEVAGGFSCREISGRLQISEKSVSNAIQRARRKLRAVRSKADD